MIWAISNIAWLNIAMYDTKRMKYLQALSQLSFVLRGVVKVCQAFLHYKVS